MAMSRGPGMSEEDVRASLWFWPAVTAVLAFLTTLALLAVRPATDSRLAEIAFPGDASAAASVLQTVATSVMTAMTLTFSLAVVALQLASQQFSPRLLREFARDRRIQAVLAVLVSTFVVSLTGLRGLDPDRPLPVLVLALALLLGLLSALALLAFLGHLVRSLRVDTMMVAAHQEVCGTIADTYPDYEDLRKAPAPGLPGPDGGTLVPSRRSGFIRAVSPEMLVDIAQRHGLFLLLGMRPGDMVVQGGATGCVWRTDGSGAVDGEALADEVHEAIQTGYERTAEQDAGLGLRQLPDIAVKAISPSINDSVTAAHAVAYCADVLVRLQGRHLGPQQHLDSDGRPRVVTPDRDNRYYLDLVCAPVRRFGRSEPQVLTALLRLLRDCAVGARDDQQRIEIARQVDLVVADMDDGLLADDAEAVHDLARRARLALVGDVDAAYRDRAGETRSV
jgi:uncharacterized membrane protein